MRRFYRLAALAAALTLAATAAQAQEKVVIGLPTSPPNVVHMPVIIAKDLGLYKKAGLDVETVSLGDGTKVYRALLAGNIDFGLTPGAPTIIGRANGATVKALSANLPKFEASMIVRANVKTMADLKGKRIGIQEPGGFADILSRSVLRAAKIDPKEVNFVSIASEDVPALVANQVDTAILHVEQEMLAKSKVPDLHAVGRMWELQPKTLYTFLSATEKTLKTKPDVTEKVVAATIEATRIMYSDKARVLPIMVKETGYPEKIISESYDFLVKNCIWDANSGLSKERVDFTANLMTKVGNIKPGKTPSYDDVVDASFAKKAIATMGEWKGPVCPTPAF
ncbi:MAG TPA: ABC transporter substrate-binding protein [Pseudolabrys sp.]|jgi:NitT/TauT family transport system substrate-binding protein|uniref:ABC transporter substrate-binding protein n=1 Tax=Pseudolabrys sp. TaxID=1960880 RepID=UPI002DDD1BAD|nr:ABC transporter substrate-binding protein [Pseudolabrys sp.]HEV2630776.1 ABC transporter substrate-binding protein [Pseudolabrys sp.]